MTTAQVFTIGIPIYDLVDLMDIAAPCEMFFWMNQTWQSKTAKQKSAQVFLAGGGIFDEPRVSGQRGTFEIGLVEREGLRCGKGHAVIALERSRER